MVDFILYPRRTLIEYFKDIDSYIRLRVIHSAFEVQMLLADCSGGEKLLILRRMRMIKELLRLDEESNERK